MFLPEANSSLQTSMNFTVEFKLFKGTYILEFILVKVMCIYLKKQASREFVSAGSPRFPSLA